jgi:predicted ArsR family transcriptional regulator
MTAHQVGAHLGVSAVAARRHLDDLERNGLVRVELLRPTAGRPAHLYVLTGESEVLFPQGYRQIVLDLLAELADAAGAEPVCELFRARNARLVPDYRARLAGKEIADQVLELGRVREEEGFMPSVQIEGELFVLREHHCPIRAVAEAYPDACRCERELFEQALGRPIQCRSTIARGASTCEFVISGAVLVGSATGQR